MATGAVGTGVEFRMMRVENLLAGIAIADLEASAAWYETIIGEAADRPMPEGLEWSLPGGGVLQVFQDPERARRSSATCVVKDIDSQVSQLSSLGMAAENRTRSDQVSTAIVKDPGGNRPVLAEPHANRLASWHARSRVDGSSRAEVIRSAA